MMGLRCVIRFPLRLPFDKEGRKRIEAFLLEREFTIVERSLEAITAKRGKFWPLLPFDLDPTQTLHKIRITGEEVQYHEVGLFQFRDSDSDVFYNEVILLRDYVMKWQSEHPSMHEVIRRRQSAEARGCVKSVIFTLWLFIGLPLLVIAAVIALVWGSIWIVDLTIGR